MLEFLKENRNIIILIALIAIAYLLLQTNLFANIKNTVMAQWYTMSNTTKLIILLIIIGVAYYYWE